MDAGTGQLGPPSLHCRSASTTHLPRPAPLPPLRDPFMHPFACTLDLCLADRREHRQNVGEGYVLAAGQAQSSLPSPSPATHEQLHCRSRRRYSSSHHPREGRSAHDSDVRPFPFFVAFLPTTSPRLTLVHLFRIFGAGYALVIYDWVCVDSLGEAKALSLTVTAIPPR